MVGSKLIPEAEDTMRAGFGGVEIIFGSFEQCEVFDRKVFWESFDREVGKIVGHSIESWGFVCRVFISRWSGAD